MKETSAPGFVTRLSGLLRWYGCHSIIFYHPLLNPSKKKIVRFNISPEAVGMPVDSLGL